MTKIEGMIETRKNLEYQIHVYRDVMVGNSDRQAKLEQYQLDLAKLNKEIREECGTYIRHKMGDECE